jgi:hypothetical protein
VKAAQNALGFAGIVLGLIPLLQYLFAGGIGLWRFLVGEAPPLPWLYPLVVLVVAAVGVVGLDRAERARR